MAERNITIALAGNPNCGKTTLFNTLTGSNQYVGNWPGVTVEKKEGKLKDHKDVTVTDLPGIYSLSPYTLEEVVARNYLVQERPDAILNIVDGTNLERNLYLTTQLVELGIPVLVAINMMDMVRKNGDRIDVQQLGKELKCQVVEISALKGDGVQQAAQAAIALARSGEKIVPQHRFAGCVEHALAHIEESTVHQLPAEQQRWYAIKLFERDEKVAEQLKLDKATAEHIEEDIRDCEREMDDDAESIITAQRYDYITAIIKRCFTRKNKEKLTGSDKIDRVMTNRWLALPIFAAIMFLIYAIAMGGWSFSIGSRATEWANDGLFGDGWALPFTAGRIWVPGIPALVESALEAIGCNEVISSLVLDGIVGGVGSVLGFVPQLLVLFLLLAILEDVGYMSRIAFIMDRLFRRFGLSGKSFIPMLVATGCGVPGIMASRTIEQDRDRKMTIMTTCFIPCSAKMPIIALFAGALFGGSAWVATSAFFIGIAAVVISGTILKKTKAFAGEPAPFVMELPPYHAPMARNILRATWDRGWSFIKRAGTVILLASIVLWFLQGFGFENGTFGMVEDNNASLLATMGGMIAFVFAPLGFGNWQATVATLTGLLAKEEVVGTLGVLYPGNLSESIGMTFTAVSAYAFMIFNLLCAPCFAAMGAIRQEMNNPKWTWAAIGYMCAFAYAIALIVNQLGGLFAGNGFGVGTVAALVVLAGIVYLLLRPAPDPERLSGQSERSVSARV